MVWDYFIYFAVAAMLCWAVGAAMAWRDRRIAAQVATVAGLAVFGAYIVMIWVALERPPLRTMGETRLWYSFFLPLAGLLLAIPLVLTYLETGLVPRFPTAILSTGIMLAAAISLNCGIILETVTTKARELKRLVYLNQSVQK